MSGSWVHFETRGQFILIIGEELPPSWDDAMQLQSTQSVVEGEICQVFLQ